MANREGLGASVPDQALAVPVEPASGLAPTGFDPSRERGCDVCGRSPVVGVASSSMGPVSFGYCLECARKPAEPEFLFGMTFEDCGTEVADWVKNIWTWKDGAYVSWGDWVAQQASQ